MAVMGTPTRCLGGCLGLRCEPSPQPCTAPHRVPRTHLLMELYCQVLQPQGQGHSLHGGSLQADSTGIPAVRSRAVSARRQLGVSCSVSYGLARRGVAQRGVVGSVEM